MFSGTGYLCSEDGIVRLRHFLVNLHTYSLSFYLVMAQSKCLMVFERDGGFNTLCQSCGFTCQQRVLKTFPGST